MIQGPKEDIHKYAHRLSMAYARVFETNSPFAEDVLFDLDMFCRMKESTFHPDQRVHAVLEGRREVGLRINTLRLLNADEALEYLQKPVQRYTDKKGEIK